MNAPRKAEENYLQSIQKILDHNIDEMGARLAYYERDVSEQKTYLWENRDEMDHVEKIATRQSIEQAVFTGDQALALQDKLRKLKKSPYFGRFDFRTSNDKVDAVYIGVHQFYDGASNNTLIYDWRAPVASLFYDYETGPAVYQAPEGEVAGKIELKRQFRIQDGEIEFMFDSAVNVMDDLLQQELGRSADEGMKNIVATIQRDQNAIIRNDQAQNLIIQGVAGSGKTSIALHRIAYLLYRFKDTLTSKDILIISPNRVFADYIANVLPELGEETVREVEMETLADTLLDGAYRFQTFFEQMDALLSGRDDALHQRIGFKSSAEFLKTLNAYADHVEKNTFMGEDIWLSGRLIPGGFLEEMFQKHRGFALNERLKRTSDSVGQRVRIEYNYDLMPEDRRALKQSLSEMYQGSTLRETYKQLFDWLERPDMFKTVRGRLEYADVFPLIYLKMRLEGKSRAPWPVKHLLIDEMQDYTPVQYAVISRLFNCKKTILGDANQSVNPYSASDAQSIRDAFMSTSLVKLTKSYRSSYEITQFAQTIVPDPDLEAMRRHGEKPLISRAKKSADETKIILQAIESFRQSEHNSLGIICKTQAQAKKLARQLEEAGEEVLLLTALTSSFSQGVVVSAAHLAKGLEFDRVIVPAVTNKNYHTGMDRHLLYVACTRAMHQLQLIYHDTPSSLLDAGCWAYAKTNED